MLKFRTPVACQNGHKALWYWTIDIQGIGEVKHYGVISKRCLCPKSGLGEGYKRIGHDQQFTGLQDKNDRDIYEGDILAYGGDNHNAVVVWGDDGYGIGFYTEESKLKGESDKRTHGLPPSTAPMEVIGNIVETPKLKSRWGRS